MFVMTISVLILQACSSLHILVFIVVEREKSADLTDVCVLSGT